MPLPLIRGFRCWCPARPGQAMAPTSPLERCTDATTLDKKELMYSELWHACAGPLVSLPCKGSRVVYFPQGHLEQVAASMKQGSSDQKIPVYDIPPQIMCRVADLSLHDYSQQRPSQELVAKDLHGVEWKFRHIYRGQPRRHLLTTGWSVFVSTKRLVAGDSVLFLRRENGELWLGIRRAARSPCSTPMSVLPSHSMHMGVLAAAAHALSTKSMFNVYYNPRTSPAEFVISHHKYRKAFAHTLSVGMRFKMRFESDDGTERRHTGTITGIGDVDSDRWRDSKWRSLKVNWDEHSTNERYERVSPWEIEPFLATGALDLPIGPGLKRYWSSFSSSTADFTTQSGIRGGSADPYSALRFSKVLQVQEAVPLREELFKGAANVKSALTGPITNDPFAEQKRLRSESMQGGLGGGRAEMASHGKLVIDTLGATADLARKMSLFQGQQSLSETAAARLRIASPLSLLKSQQPPEVASARNSSFLTADLESEKPLLWPSLMSTTLFSPNQRSNHNDSLKPPFTPSRTEAKGVANPTTETFNKYIHKSLLQFNSASAVESAELPVSGVLITVNASPSRDAENSVKLFGFSLKDSARAAAAVDRFPSAVGTTDKPPLNLEGQCIQRTHLELDKLLRAWNIHFKGLLKLLRQGNQCELCKDLINLLICME